MHGNFIWGSQQRLGLWSSHFKDDFFSNGVKEECRFMKIGQKPESKTGIYPSCFVCSSSSH